jgi:hypothetical protein
MNEVDINLDVLGATMLGGVAGHVDRTDVITEDNSNRTKWAMKLGKKLSKPAALSHDVNHDSILRLGTRPRNRGLAFRKPGDQVIAKVDTIPGGRATSVQAASPVSVRVGGDRRSRHRVQLETKVQCPLEVADDTLDQVKMRLSGSMHVDACLLDCMRDVGVRQSEVLKSTRKTPILGRIGDEGTIIGGELTTCVDGSRKWVALEHASVVKKVEDVLALREHHANG